MLNTGSRARGAIVTGGASGIGLATTARLLASGWRVAAFDRDQAAIATLRNSFGDKVRTSLLDVTDEPAVEAAVKEVVSAFGSLDGIVNSAGIGVDIPLLDTPVSQFRNVIDVNVTGTFIVGRAAARVMKDQGAGARYGIRVNAIAPGPVDTPLVQAMHPAAVRRAVLHHTPMRRYAAPDEIATAVLFLLDGTQSSFVTGVILPVDGGFIGAGLMELDEALPQQD
jgi:NAD(P)-dependent dehydrogenase (short-subunit alcohol dehydrogenase family)